MCRTGRLVLCFFKDGTYVIYTSYINVSLVYNFMILIPYIVTIYKN